MTSPSLEKIALTLKNDVENNCIRMLKAEMKEPNYPFSQLSDEELEELQTACENACKVSVTECDDKASNISCEDCVDDSQENYDSNLYDDYEYDPYGDYEYDPNHKYSQTIHILERERTPEEEHELTEMIAEERNRWHLNVVYHEMLPNKMLKVAKEERDPEWDGEPAKSTSKPSMSIHVVYEELTEEVNNAIHELIHEKQENWQVKLVYCNLLPNGIIEEDFSLTFP